MTYGTVRFRVAGEPATAELTEAGWRVGGAAEGLGLDTLLDELASPGDVSVGDAAGTAVMRAADALNGQYELVELPGPSGRVEY